MQACYAIAGHRRADWGAMLCVSAATLRRQHADVEVVVVSDRTSLSQIGTSRTPLERYTDRIVEVDGVQGTSRERSRVLKTTLRRHLEGRFVFLDLDTVILRKLGSCVGAHF